MRYSSSRRFPLPFSSGAVARAGPEERRRGRPPGRQSVRFDIGLRLFGADVGVGYNGLAFLPSAQTTIWAYVGGGIRRCTTIATRRGDSFPPETLRRAGSSRLQPRSRRWEGAWRLGLEQGFIWNARTHTNLLEAFAYYVDATIPTRSRPASSCMPPTSWTGQEASEHAGRRAWL